MSFVLLEHINQDELLDKENTEDTLSFFNIENQEEITSSDESNSKSNKFKTTLWITGLYILFSIPIIDYILSILFSYCGSFYIRAAIKIILFAALVYLILITIV